MFASPISKTAPSRPASRRAKAASQTAPARLSSDSPSPVQLSPAQSSPAQESAAGSRDAVAGGSLPQRLRSGIEALSGLDLSAVQVHRNSARPAQLHALAFAQGNQIHLGPGQERHLPHEAWHVVQQAQGRVTPTLQMREQAINDDAALEREADLMGARALQMPANGQHLQRSNAALAPWSPATAAPLQMRWIVDPASNSYFWEEDGSEKGTIPSSLRDFAEREAPDASSYNVNEGRRGRALFYSLDHWQAMNRGGAAARAATDHYNPFGRFDSSAGMVAYLPGSNMPQDAVDRALAHLREAVPHLAGVQSVSSGMVNGYPRTVTTADGTVLEITSATMLGAMYSNRPGVNRRATQDLSRVSDPAATGVIAGNERVKVAQNELTPESLAFWSGEKRSEQQAQVMGGSAADVAASAGYAANEGLGWEWLHLIAHSMGGMQKVGPQVPENLVAGTSECNTQMIIVEEFIKDLVRRGQRARLAVFARMADPVRHIADRITYDFLILDKANQPIDAFHWEFDPLNRNQPIVEENRGLRYVAREILSGTGVKVGPQTDVDDMDLGGDLMAEPLGPVEILRAQGLYAGSASGAGNMCLLDTLGQLLRHQGRNVTTQALIAFFQQAGLVQQGQMIDMYDPNVTGAIAATYGLRLQIHQWTGAAMVDHPVIGHGGNILHILHAQNHFTPLWNGGL